MTVKPVSKVLLSVVSNYVSLNMHYSSLRCITGSVRVFNPYSCASIWQLLYYICHRHLLILGSKADSHSTVPWRVDSWVAAMHYHYATPRVTWNSMCVVCCGDRKTTIVRLLFRFYDPQAGRVLINNQDIRCIDIDSLRKVVGVVPQVSLVQSSVYIFIHW